MEFVVKSKADLFVGTARTRKIDEGSFLLGASSTVFASDVEMMEVNEMTQDKTKRKKRSKMRFPP